LAGGIEGLKHSRLGGLFDPEQARALQSREGCDPAGPGGGHLKPVIAKTFPFSQMVEAHRFLESNAQVGKVVVRV